MSFFEDDVEQVSLDPVPKITAKPKSKETLDVEFREKSEINSLWVEKYRPQKLEEYIGNDELKKRIGLYISSGDIPHILLSGPPGTGKTTAAKMIANSVECDVMYINASDENSVDVVRDKIKSFAYSAGLMPLKIIILDEMDFLSPAAMAAMRNIMETFSSSTRFIMTCNYHERVIPAILSRVQAEVVTPPDKKSVAIHLVNILKKEQIEFNPVDVKFLVDSYYPDIRKIIGTAQQFSRNLEKKLIVDRGMVISGDIRTQLTDILKNGDKKTAFKNIRQLFADNRVTEKFDEFYRYLYDTVDDWSNGQSSEMIYILADMQYKSSIIPDKEINFMSCMFQILREIKK